MLGIMTELTNHEKKELIITMKGMDYKWRGTLKEVHSDYIVVNQERILLSAIASFRPVDKRGIDIDGMLGGKND